ncbi:MAG: AEC family transporter [Candidatus Bathyarchaeota archaeon]|nr:MAG: AEC family transporter [Candidatus Bathyarchaeota archaeon]
MNNIAIRTAVPILFLLGAGLLSRRRKILQSGDERVLSAYVYYFALPSLFLVNIAEMKFTAEMFAFVLTAITPVFIVLATYTILYFIFGLQKNTLYLLILTTIFGSLAFFGIPFITLAFPTDGEHLATLSAAIIAPISVTTSLLILELYKLEHSVKSEAFRSVVRRLSKNPLIISILAGFLLSFTGINIPAPLSTFLHMLGSTTSVVAIFMLGVFLYGYQYSSIVMALKLSLLRIIFLPSLTLLMARGFGLTGIEGEVLVLMHGMPIAISMIVLSERYDFYKETIASLILISSLGATIYLNLWLLVLGH